MLGVSPSFYKHDLKYVPVHLNKSPIKSFDLKTVVSEDTIKYAEDYCDDLVGPSKDIERFIHRIPLRLYKGVSFEQLCKIRSSSIFMLEDSVHRLFEKDVNYRLVRKIESSMWRWGCSRAKWNEIVDAYNGIRRFTLNRKDFSIRIDYTTSHNERGWSEYTRTYLDGVFAFLIYYKGQHVMTVGFSILSGRKILIQQIQLKQSKGNRWLFKLPSNYLEYILDVFKQTFTRYSFYLADGFSLISKYLIDYKGYLKNAEEKIEKYSKQDPSWVQYYIDDRDTYKLKIEHLTRDFKRLVTFYNNTGSFVKSSKKLAMNGVTHYRIDKIVAI